MSDEDASAKADEPRFWTLRHGLALVLTPLIYSPLIWWWASSDGMYPNEPTWHKTLTIMPIYYGLAFAAVVAAAGLVTGLGLRRAAPTTIGAISLSAGFLLGLIQMSSTGGFVASFLTGCLLSLPLSIAYCLISGLPWRTRRTT